MALDLDLSYSQSNDATTLTITDIAGTYDVSDNDDGWGDPNPRASFAFSDIVAASDTTDYSPDKYHLLLTIVVTDKEGTETTYTTINLRDHNGAAFTAASDLVFEINPSHLIASGTAMGLSTDKLTDGIYAITYQLVANHNHSTVIDSVAESVLIDGDVRIDVFNKLRQIPVDYDAESNQRSREIMEALLAYSYLQGMEASASVAMTEELYTMLYTLDKLVSDGSKYTW